MAVTRDVRLIEREMVDAITYLLDLYTRHKNRLYYRATRLKMLSHLIDRNVTTTKQVRQYEAERLLDYAVPGWREGDFTHRPAFAAFAAKLAAGYALVVAQEFARLEAQPKRKHKKNKHRKSQPQNRRRERVS